MDDEMVEVPGLPFALRWEVQPEQWSLDRGGRLAIRAGPRTDLFVDPADDTVRYGNAPRLLGQPSGDWMLSARVSVDGRSTFDAAVLTVWVDESAWAKLGFEASPRGQPTIVSVVTRGVSDDCDSWPVETDSANLRISRTGRSYAFHASTDGATWRFVRHFSLGRDDPATVGFLAQSPTGPGCTATFDGIRFEPRRLDDLRGGS